MLLLAPVQPGAQQPVMVCAVVVAATTAAAAVAAVDDGEHNVCGGYDVLSGLEY